MDHHLENELLRITVQGTGAELKSLVKRETGQEYIWSGDPAVWASTAPVLFPIIGNLKEGKTRIEGREYAIPKHGIIRHNDQLELYSKREDRLVFRLCSSEETYAVYPYHFDFRITFRLRNEHLIVYHEVLNRDDRPMLFHLGGHPAFRVPFYVGDTYEDYYLRFEHAEDSVSYQVTDAGTVSNTDTRPVPWTEGGKVLPLTHELFAQDALVFKDLESRSVNLESRNHGPVLKLDYAGWTHLGVWAKTNGDFICLEPWIGLADAAEGDGEFAHKEGIISLEPNDVYEMSYDIKIL
ncbi:aldose 1-epimerase family protein [Neolewinella sp.]|uniref:aldose 1-epimerase family protein n=1 Tax=Neolewinella sp. TaxID=2993543 RepID=UPI003B51F5BB